jgi:hypothetical protein
MKVKAKDGESEHKIGDFLNIPKKNGILSIKICFLILYVQFINSL